MVKNLRTVERSTKIRFGKNCTDDQADNTIVFNASDEQINASTSGAVYMTPIRQGDTQGFSILAYDQSTKEVVDSGLSGADVTGTPSLQDVTTVGNTTTHNLELTSFNTSGNAQIGTSILLEPTGSNQVQVSGKIKAGTLAADSYVSVNNTSPQYAISVGDSLYVIEHGANVIETSGNVSAVAYHGDGKYLSNLDLDQIISSGNSTTRTVELNNLALKTVQANYVPVTDSSNVLVQSKIEQSSDATVNVNTNLSVYGNIFSNEYLGDGGHLSNIHLDRVVSLSNTTSRTVELSNLSLKNIQSKYVPVTDSSNILTQSTIRQSTAATVEIDSELKVHGNLVITGTTTTVASNNLIVDDPIIEIANNNTLDTLDTGIIMTRGTANVAVGYRGDEQEFVIAMTHSDASGPNIIPLTDQDVNAKIYGNVTATNYFGNGTTLSGVALSADLSDNSTRISNLETSNGYIWSNLASNAGRVSNLETSNGYIWSNLASNAGRVSNLEISNGYIWSNLTSNAGRVSNLEISNGYIWSNLTSNAGRVSNLETSNGYIWSNLADNASRVSNLEISNGYIWSNLTSNAGRVSNLEISNGYIWSNLDSNAERVSDLETDKANLLDPTFTSNITVTGNVNATSFQGDGGLLSNIASTLQQVS